MGQRAIRSQDKRIKHPDEILDVPVDWSALLSPVSGVVTVSSAITTIDGGDGNLTVTSTSVVDGTFTVTRFAADGTPGTTYQYEVAATLSDGQVRYHEAELEIKDN